MLRPQLPDLILDALLRPRRLAASVAGRQGEVRWALLLIAEVLVVTAGLFLLLSIFLPLGTRALVAGPGLALALTMLAALPCFLSLPLSYRVDARLAFSLARTLIAVGVPAALGLAILLSSAYPELQRSPPILLLTIVLIGLCAGGALTVALLVSPQHSQAPALRWVCIAGALLIALLLWWSEPLRRTDAALLAPLLAGLGLGLLRPLSYCWEAPLSVVLSLAARLGAPAHRLLRLHPVGLDELCLLPLPGLSSLLARACAGEIATGGLWLVRVAAHPSQAGAARRALTQLVRHGQGHPTLCWLSTCEEGASWLRQLAAGVSKPHPLIAAYAALAAVAEPAAWPAAIGAHRHAIRLTASQPGGAAIEALLEAGGQTLAATRWPEAMAALRHARPMPSIAPDPLTGALEAVRAWSGQQLPALLPDRARALAVLWEALDTLEIPGEWPKALLDAVAEHLVYLLMVERRRGSWLERSAQGGR